MLQYSCLIHTIHVPQHTHETLRYPHHDHGMHESTALRSWHMRIDLFTPDRLQTKRRARGRAASIQRYLVCLGSPYWQRLIQNAQHQRDGGAWRQRPEEGSPQLREPCRKGTRSHTLSTASSTRGRHRSSDRATNEYTGWPRNLHLPRAHSVSHGNNPSPWHCTAVSSP